MLAMVMHRGVWRRAKKGFEQGEWTLFCNCDQAVIGLTLVKSTSRGSKDHLEHWQLNLIIGGSALMKGNKNNLVVSLEAQITIEVNRMRKGSYKGLVNAWLRKQERGDGKREEIRRGRGKKKRRKKKRKEGYNKLKKKRSHSTQIPQWNEEIIYFKKVLFVRHPHFTGRKQKDYNILKEKDHNILCVACAHAALKGPHQKIHVGWKMLISQGKDSNPLTEASTRL